MKIQIDAGKPDIGHRVDLRQVIQHHGADQLAGHFSAANRLERLDDLIARADERMYQAKARMKKRRSDRQEPVPETNGDQ